MVEAFPGAVGSNTSSVPHSREVAIVACPIEVVSEVCLSVMVGLMPSEYLKPLSVGPLRLFIRLPC